MKLIYKTGTSYEKLEKIRILDNMRDEIEKKVLQGIGFSNEATLALAAFPISDAKTIFSVVDDKIVKGAYHFKKTPQMDWEYLFSSFREIIKNDFKLKDVIPLKLFFADFFEKVKSNNVFKIIDSKNWGYSYAEFHPSRYYDLSQYEEQELIEKTAEQAAQKDWVCYYISYRELEKIGWTDAVIVPDFVIEVFTKLGCMPEEIVND